jgi:hypothetical protein
MKSECKTLYTYNVEKCRSLSDSLNFTYIKHPSHKSTVFHIVHSFISGSTAICWALVSFFQFRNHFTQSVGLLERVISPSQGR